MAGRIAYLGNISTQGLVLDLDAAIQGSYPKTGTLWTDISGNNNNGTLTNGPAYTGSDYGAIVFDGTDDFVTGSVINTPNQLSVFCFKNPKPRIGSTIYPVYIAKWSAEPPSINNRSWLIGIQPGGVEYIAISSDGFYQNNTIKRFEFSSSLSNNIWTQVGFTFNNGTLVPYLNGAPANYTASLNANITSIYTSSVGYTLGYLKDGVLDTYLSGSIANAQIYNQALSQFQVWQNFNAYKSRYGIPDIVTDGLVLNLDAGNPYSYLSGSSGTTWSNTVAVSSSISGSLINGTTYSNGAMVFDGVDDYTVVNNFSQLPVSSSARTISIWFNPDSSAWASNVNNLFFYGTPGTTGATFGIDFDIYPVMEIYTWGGTGRDLMFSSSFAQTGWANIAVTYDGSTSIKIYENGTNTQTLTLASPCNTGNTNVWIGSINPSYQSWYYPGKISNTSIYNRALTQAEITQNFNALRGRYGI